MTETDVRARTINELDSLARDFIDGEVNAKKLYGLEVFDLWAVTTLGALYSCTKVGTISQELCVKLKYVILHRYEMFKTRTVFMERIHDRYIENTARYCEMKCELARELRSERPDFIKLLGSALMIIDALTREDVYLKMFERRLADGDFKSHALKTACANMKSYEQMFGTIPYAKLLERFYAQTCEDGTAEIFKQLETDGFRKKACTAVPRKEEEKAGTVADNLYEMYGSARV